MNILILEKIGDTLFGCVENGSHYHVFSVEKDSPITIEKSYPLSQFSSYDDFVSFYVITDASAYFLEEPVAISGASPQELNYDYLQAVFKRIWDA